MTTWMVDHMRVGPWRGDPEVAVIIPSPGHVPTPTAIEGCLDILANRGFCSVVTSALSLDEQEPLITAGFAIHKRLHLLGLDLSEYGDPKRVSSGANTRECQMPSTRIRLRRGRRRDTRAVLEVDTAAFDSFWRFDQESLGDARAATSFSRWRIAHDGGVVGYAVTGRSGPVSYLQRLAVHPRHQNRGIGTVLIHDALGWAKAHGAIEMLVNTQDTNTGGLSLYERLGFVRKPQGLAVLHRSLNRSGSPL